jgi:plasmid stabilization system protein ParE
MNKWREISTEDVQNDLDNFVYYLLVEKLNVQAAKAVLDDYDETVEELSQVAGMLKALDDPELSEYRKIRLRRHDYYLIYRLEGEFAIIDRMFHDLQDLDKALE